MYNCISTPHGADSQPNIAIPDAMAAFADYRQIFQNNKSSPMSFDALHNIYKKVDFQTLEFAA